VGEAVILVHGLWMRGLVLLPLARRLARLGYRSLLFSYPSLRADLGSITALLRARMVALPEQTVHLVGHSMGALVILRLLEDFQDLPPGRVVTLGPPFQGSLTAQRLDRTGAARWLLGRNRDPLVQACAGRWSASRQLGIIAGTRGIGVGRVMGAMPGPSDGTVLLAETVLEGAADRIELPTTHTGLLISARASKQVHAFLRDGRFTRP
jgi:pimeloyl-ACP methyl ester carboxylesterase